MFLLHQNKALCEGLKVSTGVAFGGIIFAEVFLDRYDIAYRYAFIVALISVSFAVGILLFATLLERYERIPSQFDEENED